MKPSEGDVPGLEVTPIRSGMVPLWSCATHCWCALDHWIYRYDYRDDTLRRIFRLPRASRGAVGWIKDGLARSRLRQWLQPGSSIHHLVELLSGDLVIVFDRVYLYSQSEGHACAEVIPTFGAATPATPLRAGVAVHTLSGHVYYGEYHDDPGGTRVVRVDPRTRSAHVCWHFPRAEIRHIHAIHFDRFRNRLWICTGDRDHESSLFYTDDEFTSVHRFAGGDQTWRAIAMLFDESGMEWGMDAGKDAPADAVNRIYHYDFETKQRSERKIVGNPVYAACGFADGTAVMQTSFEPGRLQDTPQEAALWFRDSTMNWRRLHSSTFRPVHRQGAGRYGAFWIPYGTSPPNKLLFVPINCGDGSNRMYRLTWRGLHG